MRFSCLAWLGLFVSTSACGGATATDPLASGGALGSGGALAIGGALGASGGDFTGGAESSGGAPNGGTTSGGAASGGATTGDQGLVDYLGNPNYPDSAWQPATFEEAGIDRDLILGALAKIASHDDWEVHSFLIVHRGKLVLEHYGWDTGTNPAVPGSAHQVLPNERHPLFSTTKSILSALIGMALDEGDFDSLEVKAADYFPDYAELNPSEEKSQITLEDLLTMRSGLEWTEGDQTTFEAPDPARAMFARDVVTAPGETWNYSTGGSDVLAEMLSVATGVPIADFANEKLFGPLGIESVSWLAGASGVAYGGFGLSLTSREMARFGEMYRNRGDWLGEQVVPADWTDESTLPRCPTPWGGQYGYHFWVPDLPGFFSTLGAFGQLIYVSRDLELVVVFTANMPSDTADNNLRSVIANYVVPAVPSPVR
jgi:CubicO group peptidase (beta-lactamase class C family)